MTTQELVERLTWKAEDQAREASEDRSDGFEYEASIHDKDADLLRAAASRLSEMEDTLKRLRKQLSETMMDIAIYEDVGVIRARAMERRAALDKGEPKL